MNDHVGLKTNGAAENAVLPQQEKKNASLNIFK